MLGRNKIDVVNGKVKNLDSAIVLSGTEIVFENEETEAEEFKITVDGGELKTWAFSELENDWVPADSEPEEPLTKEVIVPDYSSTDFIKIEPGKFSIFLKGEERLRLENREIRADANGIIFDNNQSGFISLNLDKGLAFKDEISNSIEIWLDKTEMHVHGKEITGLQQSEDPSSAVTLEEITDLNCNSLEIQNGNEKLVSVENKEQINYVPVRYGERPEVFTNDTLVDAEYVLDLVQKVACNGKHGNSGLDSVLVKSEEELTSNLKLTYSMIPILSKDTDLVHLKFVNDNYARKEELTQKIALLSLSDLEKPSANVDVGQFKLINILEPTDDNDAVNKIYVDTKDSAAKEYLEDELVELEEELEIIESQEQHLVELLNSNRQVADEEYEQTVLDNGELSNELKEYINTKTDKLIQKFYCQDENSIETGEYLWPEWSPTLSHFEEGTYKIKVIIIFSEQIGQESAIRMSLNDYNSNEVIVPAREFIFETYPSYNSQEEFKIVASAKFTVDNTENIELYCDFVEGVENVEYMSLEMTTTQYNTNQYLTENVTV